MPYSRTNDMPQYHKTTIEIDLEQLEQARTVLRTGGIKDTVNSALREVARRAALDRAADFVLAGKMQVPDLEDWAAGRELRVHH